MKKVGWVGNSQDEAQKLPKSIRKAIGFQINLLQQGLEPDDFKSIPTVGKGVFEIRVRNDLGQNTGRCFYIAKFEGKIFILHAFEKKQQTTPKQNLEIGRKRYRELMNHMRSKNER